MVGLSIDSHERNLEGTVILSAKQGDVGLKVGDTLKPVDVLLDDTGKALPAAGLLHRLLDRVLAGCKTVKSLITRIGDWIISFFCRAAPKGEEVHISVEELEKQAVEAKARAQIEQEEKEKVLVAEAAKAAKETATENTRKVVQETLGVYLDKIKDPNITHAEKLNAFSQLLKNLHSINIKATDLELIEPDGLPTAINSYCRSAYNELPEVIKKELNFVPNNPNTNLEIGEMIIETDFQSPEILTAVDQLYESFPSYVLTQNQEALRIAERDLEQVQALLRMMQIRVVDFEPEVTQECLNLALKKALSTMPRLLKVYLEGGIWGAVLDPENKMKDTTALKSLQPQTVSFTYAEGNLSSNEADFGEKILEMDPCGQVAQAGLLRWMSDKTNN